jgi:hypothetical protein
MNRIHILYDDICQIGRKPPDEELWVIGRRFWTTCLWIFHSRFRRAYQSAKVSRRLHGVIRARYKLETQTWVHLRSRDSGGNHKKFPLSMAFYTSSEPFENSIH